MRTAMIFLVGIFAACAALAGEKPTDASLQVAPLSKPEPSPSDRCLWDGYRVGMQVPDLEAKKPKEFSRRDPELGGMTMQGVSYRQQIVHGPFEQYLFYSRAIIGIVREFPGIANTDIYEALVQKYGQPRGFDVLPSSEIKVHPFVRIQGQLSRASWEDRDCDALIQLVKKVDLSASLFSTEWIPISAIVITALPKTKEGESIYLK